MSTAPGRRLKPPPPSDRRHGAVQHRKRSRAGPAWRGLHAWAAVVAVAGVIAVVATGAVAAGHAGRPRAQAGAWLAEAAGELATWSSAWGSQPDIVSATIASGAGGAYRNPLRAVSGLVPARIDDGVDFTGAGPVYALGDAVVTSATGTNYGWPGGGWITYRLTDGPAAGLVVYVAEDITPSVSVGQRVSPSTVVGTMFDGGDGIETGWAQLSSLSAESELPEAGAIGGLGPFPTRLGVSFDRLLHVLGVPAAPNSTQREYGLLPPGYPASWK